MRTTIRIDDQLMAEIKQYAARTGKTLTSVIEDALRQMLDQNKKASEREPVRLFTVHGNGTLPGVDLDDSAALLELMEEEIDSS